jgi:hypothetical protein
MKNKYGHLVPEEVRQYYKKSCYDPMKEDCDGRCQGCSDCPMAEFYRDRYEAEEYGGKIPRQPTPLQMYRKSIKYMKEFRKLKEICDNDPKIQGLLKQFRKDILGDPK